MSTKILRKIISEELQKVLKEDFDVIETIPNRPKWCNKYTEDQLYKMEDKTGKSLWSKCYREAENPTDEEMDAAASATAQFAAANAKYASENYHPIEDKAKEYAGQLGYAAGQQIANVKAQIAKLMSQLKFLETKAKTNKR